MVEDWGRWRNFEPGMWAWFLHGGTGGVVLGYLVAQIVIYGVAFWMGQDTFVSLAQTLGESTLIHLVNFVVFVAFVYHMFNGLRITLFDMAIGVDSQRALFYLVLVLTVIVSLAGVPFFLAGVL